MRRLINSMIGMIGKRLGAMRRRRRSAQAAVEYMLTTLILVTMFASLYGFLQGQLKTLFVAAGTAIIRGYY